MINTPSITFQTGNAPMFMSIANRMEHVTLPVKLIPELIPKRNGGPGGRKMFPRQLVKILI